MALQKEPYEYADLFPTGQYGRLYISSRRFSCGTGFQIQVLPAGEAAEPGYDGGPCENSGAVLVYEHTGESKECGWIYRGPWIEDFEAMAKQKFENWEAQIIEAQKREYLAKKEREVRDLKRLADYKVGDSKITNAGLEEGAM